MTRHPIPEWMQRAVVTEDRCEQCLARMHYEAVNGSFCFACWEWRTRITVEKCERAKAMTEQRQREANGDMVREDDARDILAWADEQAEKQNWARVLEYKWRIAVFVTTGKRLPQKANEPEQLEVA